MSEARLSLVRFGLYGSRLSDPDDRRPETPGARATLQTRAALTTPSARGRAALAVRATTHAHYATAAHCCRLSRFSGHAAAASMRCNFPSILAQTSLAGASHTFKPSNLATTQKATPAAATPAAATPTAATPAAATPAAATPATTPAAARRCHRPPLPPPDRPPRRCDAHRCNARRDRTSNPLSKGGRGGDRPLNRAAPAHGPTTRSHRTSIMTSMHIFKDLKRRKVPRPAVINQAKMANPPRIR